MSVKKKDTPLTVDEIEKFESGVMAMAAELKSLAASLDSWSESNPVNIRSLMANRANAIRQLLGSLGF